VKQKRKTLSLNRGSVRMQPQASVASACVLMPCTFKNFGRSEKKFHFLIVALRYYLMQTNQFLYILSETKYTFNFGQSKFLVSFSAFFLDGECTCAYMHAQMLDRALIFCTNKIFI